MTAPESALSIARKAEELAAKATPGPWRVCACGCGRLLDDSAHRFLDDTGTNADFIAFARTALPILARAVIEAEAIVEAAQAVNDANGEKLRHGRASRIEVRLDYTLRTKRSAP